VSAATWQGRAAVALLAGALGEGVCAVLAISVSNGFAVATLAVAILIGWHLGPVFGGFGASFPPVAIAFFPSSDVIGRRISAAVFVALLLGGLAWITGRVRDRYGQPPWARPQGSDR
jgi:hypothetical protein